MNDVDSSLALDPSLKSLNGTMTGAMGAIGTIGHLFMDLADTVRSQQRDLRMTWSRIRNLSTYCFSYYGISWLVLCLALNRIAVLCSTNGDFHAMSPSRRYMKKCILVALRVFALTMLIVQLYSVMVALNLYTHISLKPSLTTLNLEVVRFLLPDKYFAYDPTTAGSSMLTPKTQVMIGPTTDMYWNVFVSLCILLTVDFLLSVLDGNRPMKSGMTVFEHSLAFKEFGSSSRPTEQLLVMIVFLLLDHIHVHMGALIPRYRYRLIPSTIIGLAAIAYFLSCIMNGSLFGFPLITIYVFTPQLILILVVLLSFVIILMGFVANGFSFHSFNFSSFLAPVGSGDATRINFGFLFKDDFHHVLVAWGMLALNTAGKTSYMSELGQLRANQLTWVECDKFLPHNKGQCDDSRAGRLSYANIADRAPITPLSESSRPMNTFSLLIANAIVLVRLLGQLCWGLLQKSLRKIGLGKVYGFSWLNHQRIPPYLTPCAHALSAGESNNSLVDLEPLSNTEISERYIEILNGNALSMTDTLATFEVSIIESDSECDSDYESQAHDDDSVLVGGEKSALQELLSGTDLTELLTSQDIEIVRSHMAYNRAEGIMTRDRFRKSGRSERELLLGLLTSVRSQSREEGHLLDEEKEQSDRLLCVVCQTNIREIVTWPCKCFSICELCRLSLVSRGIDGCVCCRRPVKGVTRVFIP